MALSKKDIEAEINTVIDGDYKCEKVTVKNNCVFVGNKQISGQTCSKHEEVSETEDSENVKKTKKKTVAKIIGTVLFPPAAIVTAKSVYRDYYSYGKLIKIYWRNGQESLVFVDQITAGKIDSIFF